MIELPDDELDKLFRKSSEELDPTYEPDDWNELRKRLDQQDGRNPAGWWRKWWPAGLLALLIPIGLVLYSWEGEDVVKGEGRKETPGVVSESGVVGDGENVVAEDGGSARGVVEDGGVKAAGGGPGTDAEASGVIESGGSEAAEGVKKAPASVDNEIPAVDNANEPVVKRNRAAGNSKKILVIN